MKYKVEIFFRSGVLDAEGDSALSALQSIGYKVQGVSSGKIFVIETGLKKRKVEEMCDRLLANPIIQEYRVTEIKQ